MRLLAFAALAVLFTQPEAMLGPSFQMSFAAVLALMSAYEFVRARRPAAGERQGEALIEDCRMADVVVSLVPVGGSCATASTLLDRFDLWRDGAHAIWLGRDAVRVESVNGVRGDRPWVLRPRRHADEEPDDDPDAVGITPSRGGQ